MVYNDCQVGGLHIDDFYGGGINAAKPITGNIAVTINHSNVDVYCGGPKFGEVGSGKTVNTSATGSTFGKFFGAGYGGTSYNRKETRNSWSSPIYDWGTWANDYTRSYSGTNGGISTSYEYEYFAWAGGTNNNNVGKKNPVFRQDHSYVFAIMGDVWSW